MFVARPEWLSMSVILERALPRGYPIDDRSWSGRHKTVVWLLWAHVAGLGIYGLIRGVTALHIGIELLLIAGITGVAAGARSRSVQAVSGTIGLISCSALLVHLSGGLIEAHFHFFIMVVVVTLYQSWVPFLLAMLYVIVHHGTVGVLDPESVYNHQAAINNPWLWALIHGLFIAGAALAALRSWKFAENESERAENATNRLLEREVRHRDAIQLNDTVVQGLVTAKYAASLGRPDQAASAVDETLRLAKQLVSDLMGDDEELKRPGGLRRDAPAQTSSS